VNPGTGTLAERGGKSRRGRNRTGSNAPPLVMRLNPPSFPWPRYHSAVSAEVVFPISTSGKFSNSSSDYRPCGKWRRERGTSLEIGWRQQEPDDA
jgi:hypothetical protein